jgi:deoxyribodipyrimidine photo-lyase
MGRPFNEKFADVIWESVNDSDSELDTSSADEGKTVKGKINGYFKSTGKGKEKAQEGEEPLTNFERWKNGMTGYPIVDAAMRCANEMGWMHNRMRMITAMFLCKHLMLDWREGERVSFSYCGNAHAGADGDFVSTLCRF